MQDLLLKGVKIIKDETSILQEEMEERRTRPKLTKRYFVEEDSESDNSDSVEKNSDEDYEPGEKKPKLKNKVSKQKDSESGDSDSQEESPDYAEEDSVEEKPKSKNKASKHKSVKLTEYERLVQKNKEEKMAFLDSLKIDEIKESFAEAVGNLKPKRKKHEKRPVIPIIPRTNQLRSVKVKMNLSEEALETKAMRAASYVPQKKKLPQIITFKDALQEKEYEDFTENFNDLEEYSTEVFQDYEPHLQRMQLLGTKVTPFKDSVVSCVCFHPMREKIIIASSSKKYGKIGLWNVGSNSNPYLFEAHSESITYLKFKSDQPNILVSSSSDGTVRFGDIEKKVFNEVYKAKNTGCTYFDFVSPQALLVAQNNGYVSVVDIRINGKSSSKTHYCHDASIKSISINPQNKNYFISAENDGIIRLWDLRQLKKKPTFELETLKGVSSAIFSPCTGKYILSSSSNEASLYYSPNLTQIFLKNTLKQRKANGNRLHKIKAAWLPNRDDIFIVGNRLRGERIGIYNDKMQNIYNYENLRCQPLPHMFHPSLPLLAAVNYSGQISILEDRTA